MQILRNPSITETQFLGAAAAFSDSLSNALNGTLIHLRRLADRPKGAAFAFEMQMDQDRYRALIVLERWAHLVHAFGPHLQLGADQNIIDEAPARVQMAENLLVRSNRLIDAASLYSQEVIAACEVAFNTIENTFAKERETVARMASMGIAVPPEYNEMRRIFLADLAAR